MNWYTFLAISILGETFGRVLQKFLLKNSNISPAVYAVCFELIAGTIFLIYALFTGVKIPTSFNGVLPNLLLLPFIYAATVLLTFKAMKTIEASVFTILFNTRVIFVVLGAVFLLKNPFSINQFWGMAFILSSVILVSFKKTGFKLQKGELLTLLAGFCLAIGVLNDSIILKNKFDLIPFIVYGFLGPGLLIWIFNLKLSKEIFALLKSKEIFKLALLSCCFGTAYLTYNLAYLSGNNAAQIAAIFPISSVTTVLLSIIILKERSKIGLKIIGALVGFIGVLLVS